MINPMSRPASLSLFYINDLHGNIENMSGMLAASDAFDKKTAQSGVDALKLSAGDNFSGADDKKNQLVINLLARMGIKYSAVGNHEFDNTITTFYKFLNPDKTKFLAANAKTDNNNDFYKNVQKSDIIEINGNKYGVVGLLPFDLETVSGKDQNKLQGVSAENIDKSVEIVNEEVKKLQSQGVNKIILVSHIGNDKDKEIAQKLHGVDIIVGGHSHTEVVGIKQNENLVQNADNEPLLILQTGENAKNAGVLDVQFDNNGVITAAQNNLIKVRQDKSPVLTYLENAAMGKSPELVNLKLADPLPENRRITPCAWTNFMCDAMKEETGADIAFINAANTRRVPKAGIITERDITSATPLKNTLLVKKMTEKEVVRAIKDALTMTFSNETGEPGILHVSGLSYTGDTNGNLIELSFVDKNGNKIPIDINNPSDKVYQVCYDSFVEKGTEYPVFVPDTMTYKEVEQRFDFDKDKLVIDHLKKSKTDNLEIKDDNRIKILDSTGKMLKAENSSAEDKTETKNIQAQPQPVILPYFNPNMPIQTFCQPVYYPQNTQFMPVYGQIPVQTANLNSFAAVQGYNRIA